MQATESGITADSDYYLYTPSKTARALFLYPTIVGRFTYEAGYALHRAQLASYLLMLIEHGSCEVSAAGKTLTAGAGSLVLLDCHQEHGYKSAEGWQALCLHFDGVLAERYYRYLRERCTESEAASSEESARAPCVLKPAGADGVDTARALLLDIYRDFKEQRAVREAALSARITALLNTLLSDSEPLPSVQSDGIQRAVSYINEHYREPLQLEALAEIAALSPFYFTRLFTKYIGLSPHQYLIATRLSAAKFLLSTTCASIKEIAYQTGFSEENSFSVCFKKHERITPTQYRNGA